MKKQETRPLIRTLYKFTSSLFDQLSFVLKDNILLESITDHSPASCLVILEKFSREERAVINIQERLVCALRTACYSACCCLPDVWPRWLFRSSLFLFRLPLRGVFAVQSPLCSSPPSQLSLFLCGHLLCATYLIFLKKKKKIVFSSTSRFNWRSV